MPITENGYIKNGGPPLAKSSDSSPKENGTTTATSAGEGANNNKLALDKMDSIPVAPKKSPGTGIIRRKSRKSMIEEPDELAKLPKIKDQPKLEERMKLAMKKMQLCQRIFNFNDSDTQISSKQAKRRTLEELLDFLRNLKGAITEKFYSELFALISANIFRDLPPREDEINPMDFELAAQQQSGGPDDEPDFGNCPDPAWTHLELIYEIFLHFFAVLEFRATLAKKFVDQEFVQRLFVLFESEDPRERQFLVKIVRRIYAKFIRLRLFIRKQCSFAILAFLYEQKRFCGVAEILDILQSIVDDFRVPLKTDSKELLHKIVLPLHKPNKCFGLYREKLADRVVQFIGLDPELTEPVINSLLKCWPTTSCAKELHFLDEIERILRITELDPFKRVVTPLFKQMAKCIASRHCQVSNQALQLWKEGADGGGGGGGGRICHLLTECNSQICPLVQRAISQTASGHWHTNVRSQAKDVENILAQRNWKLWNRLVAEMAEEEAAKEEAIENGKMMEDEGKAASSIEEEAKRKKEQHENQANGHAKNEDKSREEAEEEEESEYEYEDEEEFEDEEGWEWEYVDEEEEEAEADTHNQNGAASSLQTKSKLQTR